MDRRAVHGNTSGRFRSNGISKIESVPRGLLSEKRESHKQRNVHGDERRYHVECVCVCDRW